MGDPIQKRILNINYTGGNFPLKRAESFKFDPEKALEVAKSTEGPIGYHIDDKGGTWTVMAFAETGTPEVNWHRLEASNEKFSMTTQDWPNGSRIQYLGCQVEKVGSPTENNGKHMVEVTGKFLQKKVLR